MDYLIAPSKVTSEDMINDVVSFIFDSPFGDLNQFRVFCNVGYTIENTYQPRNNYDLKQTLSTYFFHWTITHNITVDEDSGYLLLSDLVTKFADILKKEFNVNFKYHPQRQVCKNSNPGRNPSTDCSIIHMLVSRQLISEVLYEYKPAINSNILLVESSQLIELLLQAYYELRYSKKAKSLIGCLTDLFTWHYFKLTLTDTDNKLQISWYYKLTLRMPCTIPEQNITENELEQHVIFLLHHLQHCNISLDQSASPF